MKELTLNQEDTIFSKIGKLFLFKDGANFLLKKKIGILIVLPYIKAKEWPRKNQKLVNDPVIKIPLVWAFFEGVKENKILMSYGIHPTKCFPSLYNKENKNSKKDTMPIFKNKKGLTLAGCPRNRVLLGTYSYEVQDLIPKYCSIFGIPDSCYAPSFEEDMIKFLKSKRKLEIWCFERTPYIEEKVTPLIKLNFMKGQFLPSQHFPYVEGSENFLRGLFRLKDLLDINQELWYSLGKELIGDIDIDEGGFRFEEIASLYITKRLIFEFSRQLLLLQNKNSFFNFTPKFPKKLAIAKINNVQGNLDKIINKIKVEAERHIKNLMALIKGKIDISNFNKSKFLVMDIEYIPIRYPKQEQRVFNFPCVFSSLLWLGPKEGFKVNIDVLNMPCHVCSEKCSSFKKTKLDFDCLPYCYNFLDKQITWLEEILGTYEGIKIYTYGKSDVFQLENANNLFKYSFEIKRFKLRNRKREKRIIELSHDLSVDKIKLADIEKDILSKWIAGWKRKSPKPKLTSRFMTKFGSTDWENKYKGVIESCVLDTISAFLFLLYKNYKI